MKIILLVFFGFLSLPVLAQDITGIWRGSFNQVTYIRDPSGNNIPITNDRYKFEVQLDQHSNRFSGVTYSYKTTIFYGKASANGTVNLKTKKVLLDELKLVEVRMADNSDACVMRCFLQYTKNGEEEFLEGTYSSMNVRDSSDCGRGTVFLRRVVTSDFYKEPFLVERDKQKEKEIAINKPRNSQPATNKPVITRPQPQRAKTNPPKESVAQKKDPVAKPEETEKRNITGSTESLKLAAVDSLPRSTKRPAPVITPPVLASRENEVVKTIITKSREITINVYDNGAIDNDTVSVYLDKKLVVSRERLTMKPIQVKFTLDDDNDYHELVMVAENLGEIPPNTSLMVVIAGDKRYEVRITSNEQKNAVVIFKFDKG